MSKKIFLSDDELLNLYLFLRTEIRYQKEVLDDPDIDDNEFEEAASNVEVLTPIKDKIFKFLKQNVVSVNGIPLAEFLRRSV